MSREIKKLIAQGAHDIEIEEAAVSAGIVSPIMIIIIAITSISSLIFVISVIKYGI